MSLSQRGNTIVSKFQLNAIKAVARTESRDDLYRLLDQFENLARNGIRMLHEDREAIMKAANSHSRGIPDVGQNNYPCADMQTRSEP